MESENYEIIIISKYNSWVNDELINSEYIGLILSFLKQNKINGSVDLVYSKNKSMKSIPDQFSIFINKIDLDKTIELLKSKDHSMIKYRDLNDKNSAFIKIGFHF